MFLNLNYDQISSYSPAYTKLYLAAFTYAEVTNPRNPTLSVWFQPIISCLSAVTCDLALVTRLFPCSSHRPWTFTGIISRSLFLLVLCLCILVIYLFTNLIIHPFFNTGDWIYDLKPTSKFYTIKLYICSKNFLLFVK